MPRRQLRELNVLRKRSGPVLEDLRDGIRTQRGRMGLAFLAIAIGIASLAALIAVSGGLREKSREMVQELGANVIGIFDRDEPGRLAAFRLEDRHARLLAVNLPGCTVTTVRVYKVPTLGTNELVSVAATDEALIEVRQWQLESGRFLDASDLANRERNAVVSRSLSRLWGWKVGALVILGDVPFRVVGIVAVGSGALDAESADPRLSLGERVIFVPKTVAPYWATDPGTSEHGIDAIFVRVPAPQDPGRVLAVGQRLLSQPDNLLDGFSWVTPETLIRRVESIRHTIALTVGSIVALCLLLGGTTLMSLMVANVRERVAEIGLRRAIGASETDIASLFILEACLVTCAAALVGTAGTHLLLLVFQSQLPVPLRLGAASVLLPPVAAVALGAAFAYWPARLAARITPSEALRNE
jgi:putative ABC transport system permease protein